MGEAKIGLKTAVAEMQALTERMQKGEQLALIPSAAAIADHAAVDDVAERSGPGRPAGSRNRRTLEWQNFLLARYRSPLLFLAECYSRPVGELAAELGCDVETAFKLQVMAAKELAPFVHSKMPVGVQVDSRGVVRLVINVGDEAADPGDDSAPIGGQIIDHENDAESKG